MIVLLNKNKVKVTPHINVIYSCHESVLMWVRTSDNSIINKVDIPMPKKKCKGRVDMTAPAFTGAETLQSHLRGVCQDNIPLNLVNPFLLFWVRTNEIEPYLALQQAPLSKIRKLMKKYLPALINNKLPNTLLVSHQTFLDANITDEDFLTSITLIPSYSHPDDKGFVAYCTEVIGEDKIKEKIQRAGK